MRQMIALQHIRRHEGRDYAPGDYLYASDADARYLVKHGKAAPAAPESDPEPAASRRRGRPPKIAAAE